MVARAGGNPDTVPDESDRKQRALTKRRKMASDILSKVAHIVKYAKVNGADPVSVIQEIYSMTSRVDVASQRLEKERLQPCEDNPAWVAQKEKRNMKHSPLDGVTSGRALEMALGKEEKAKGSKKQVERSFFPPPLARMHPPLSGLPVYTLNRRPPQRANVGTRRQHHQCADELIPPPPYEGWTVCVRLHNTLTQVAQRMHPTFATARSAWAHCRWTNGGHSSHPPHINII